MYAKSYTIFLLSPSSLYDRTPMTPIITPPIIPPAITIDPVETCPDALPPPFRRLVDTVAAEPLLEPEATKLPVAEGETSGVWGVMEFVGAATLLRDAAKLKGARPLES